MQKLENHLKILDKAEDELERRLLILKAAMCSIPVESPAEWGFYFAEEDAQNAVKAYQAAHRNFVDSVLKDVYEGLTILDQWKATEEHQSRRTYTTTNQGASQGAHTH
ncbi:MAG: hypothetical protein ACOVSW_13265 [Candidatus Kapaibacteriota bacterium]|jgi:hypothetical protein